ISGVNSRGDVMFVHGFLVGSGCGVVILLMNQLGSVRLLLGDDRQPPMFSSGDVGLLCKVYDFCVEVEGLVLVVHEYTCEFDLHDFSPKMDAYLTAILRSFSISPSLEIPSCRPVRLRST